MSWIEDTGRSAMNSLLDYFGVNEATIRSLKNTGKYQAFIQNINSLAKAIEAGDLTISDLKSGLTSEIPLSNAYNKISAYLNKTQAKVNKMKNLKTLADTAVTTFDTSDVINVGANLEKIGDLSKTVEDTLK